MKQCGNCGKKSMARAKVQGPFPWKDFPAMLVHSPIDLLKCSNCSEVGYLPGDTKKVDLAVEATIRGLTIGFINTILEREHCTQISLAGRIGVTPEYVSQLKSGGRTPSFQTFNMLKILSEFASAFRVSDPIFELEKMVAESGKDNFDEALKKLA